MSQGSCGLCMVENSPDLCRKSPILNVSYKAKQAGVPTGIEDPLNELSICNSTIKAAKISFDF